jgi:hypothetical protein
MLGARPTLKVPCGATVGPLAKEGKGGAAGLVISRDRNQPQLNAQHLEVSDAVPRSQSSVAFLNSRMRTLSSRSKCNMRLGINVDHHVMATCT